MQYRIKTIKNINLMRVAAVVFLMIYSVVGLAQTSKVDGVDVVVGKNVVLNSDIEKFKLEIERRSEGKLKVSDCEMLERLMMQKLLSHHAVIDSVLVTEDEVNSSVERNLAFFIQQNDGDVNKVVKLYGFNDLKDLKKELFSIEKENALVRKEQDRINEKVNITPEEVRIFYNSLKNKNELPKFQAEIEIAQLVINAEPSKKEIDRILNKLKAIKKEIEEGASFRMKAILNSDDPTVTQNGGRLPVTKNANLVREFIEMAFSLDVNEVSEPFKTQYGYHIIQLHAVKGNQRMVSHILMQPEIPSEKLKETENKIAKIRKDILDKKLTFEEAVKKYSDDKDTKGNGGLIMNPNTNDTKFELTRMPPSLFERINNTKKGMMTEPFYDETQGGEKMYKIIYMKDRTDNHTADFVKDYVKLQKLALEKKKDETVMKWSKEKIKDTYIKINSTYNKCKFVRNWRKES